MVHTRDVSGRRPVSSTVRDGAHSACCTYDRRKVNPSSARRWKLGVTVPIRRHLWPHVVRRKEKDVMCSRRAAGWQQQQRPPSSSQHRPGKLSCGTVADKSQESRAVKTHDLQMLDPIKRKGGKRVKHPSFERGGTTFTPSFERGGTTFTPSFDRGGNASPPSL